VDCRYWGAAAVVAAFPKDAVNPSLGAWCCHPWQHTLLGKLPPQSLETPCHSLESKLRASGVRRGIMKVQSAIETKLKNAFDAQVLSVENESHMHSVPPNSETHFKVTLVSPGFSGQMKVKRHQAIYKVLADELAGPVHALALHLYTPEEWAASGQAAPDSPGCMGGSKGDDAMAAKLGQGVNS